jgi:hypothetical protein
MDFAGRLRGKSYELASGGRYTRFWKLLCGSEWISVFYS